MAKGAGDGSPAKALAPVISSDFSVSRFQHVWVLKSR